MTFVVLTVSALPILTDPNAVAASPEAAGIPFRTVVISDGRDRGLLDLRMLEAARLGPGTQVLRVAITTWTRWDRRLLTWVSPHRLVLLFDTDGDGRANYEGRMIFEQGGLTLQITGSGSAFEPLEVQSVGPATLVVVVPGDSPPNPAGRRVHIAVQSRYVRPGTTCDPGCIDRIPDAGWIRTP